MELTLRTVVAIIVILVTALLVLAFITGKSGDLKLALEHSFADIGRMTDTVPREI